MSSSWTDTDRTTMCTSASTAESVRLGDLDTVRETCPDPAALDCRRRAVLSPGFVNTQENPAYSYVFPDASLNTD